jgi:hypothetical protein
MDDRVGIRLAKLLARENVHRILHPGENPSVTDLPR